MTEARVSRKRRQPLQTLVLVTPVVLLAERAWAWRWMSDDGFINLRVVRQILAGHGPVFNAGQRVEAVTSPAWIWLLTVFDAATPVRLEWLAVVLGIALTLSGVAMIILGAIPMARTRRADNLMVPAGALVLVALPPVWEFASSGLEGGLALAWLGGCFLAMARRASKPAKPIPLWLPVLIGLGPLVRPDFALFSLIFLCVLLLSPKHRLVRPRLAILGVALGAPVVYQLFRMGYYAAIGPNTTFAKEASLSWWAQGWRYAVDFAAPYWLWFPLALLLGSALLPLLRDLRKRDSQMALVAFAFPLAGGLHALYVVKVGGDFMHGRMLLPALFAILAPIAVVPLERMRSMWPHVLVGAWVLVCLASLRPPTPAYAPFLRFQVSKSIVDDRALTLRPLHDKHPVTISDFVGQGPRQARTRPTTGLIFDGSPVTLAGSPVQLSPNAPSAVYLAFSLGLTGYEAGTNAYVLDVRGLADVFTSRLKLAGRGRPGHEKTLPPSWLEARFLRTDASLPQSLIFLLTSGQTVDRPASESSPLALARDSALAKRALQCGTVHELMTATTGPLGFNRFIHNITRALALSGVRIPPEPEQAVTEFCDGR